MEENRMRRMKTLAIWGLLWIAVMSSLSLVCFVSSNFLTGETIGQWVWFDKASFLSVGCILLAFFLMSQKCSFMFVSIISWALVVLGGIEAIWGIRQLYGFTASGHSMYALTGSFFNPGPYSGYLAMILPICLHQWFTSYKQKEVLDQDQHEYSLEKIIWWGKRIVSGGTMLLVLCVLPAGMSRSAWLAAGISCLWVYGCYADWGDYIREKWWLHKRRIIAIMTGGLCVLLLAGCLLFILKPDSARGRLFMWKITCNAIAEKPWLGHGMGNFASAFGDAQEAYFAAGDYELWEERVAGSPEYAFNEYLQIAVELGILLTLCLLVIVLACLYIGIRKRRYGICGAILALMIFAFSSYPLQLPAFIVTFGGLLFACILGNSRWEWLGLAILAGTIGGFRLKDDLRTEQACREWMNAKVLYNVGAYKSAEEDYERLYPLLKDRAAFLFEYGHGLHKQQKFEASNRILKEALKRSSDPMILNILGKNSQQSGDYLAAEDWFIRSTHRLPGRIYPYYLLAKLYAEPGFSQPDKFKEMKLIVLTKEPKVNSTAIRQMREEVKSLYDSKESCE